MRNKFFVFTLSFMLLLTSCTNNSRSLLGRRYISSDITYSEPTAQYAFRMNMDSVETQFAKYYFDENIKIKERKNCIKTTDKLLSSLSVQGVAPEIYIFSQEKYDYKHISDHKLYSSIQNWKSVEYITDVLLVSYGKSAHYGITFGYANYLAKGYKWNSYDSSFSNPSVQDMLDLNYLCFDEAFSSIEEVKKAQEIACDFVDSYIEQHGEQEFKQLMLSHSRALDALSAYYSENGVSYIPSTIQYRYGGRSYDYIVCSDLATFYIANDWVDMNAEYNPLISDGFLHSNYVETKAFFETNLNQMKQYQILFKLNDYNNDLDIVFSKPINASKYSFYQSVVHRIYLYNVDSLMHEYIHALTMPTSSMARWQVEGFARYFSYYYDLYGIAFLNQDYNHTPDTPKTKYIREYLATINRPIDIAKDYCEIENVAVYYFNFTDPNADYGVGSSFIQYLVKQYGEEAAYSESTGIW